MQEYIEEKSYALVIQGAKITAHELRKALEILLRQMKTSKRQQDSKTQSKTSVGKQSMRDLSKDGASLSSIEITDDNIKSFERVARKYNINFALKKDKHVDPPKWVVFFKGRDADSMTAAFKEYTGKSVTRGKGKKPSILGMLDRAKEHAKKQIAKVRNKKQEHEL